MTTKTTKRKTTKAKDAPAKAEAPKALAMGASATYQVADEVPAHRAHRARYQGSGDG